MHNIKYSIFTYLRWKNDDFLHNFCVIDAIIVTSFGSLYIGK